MRCATRYQEEVKEAKRRIGSNIRYLMDTLGLTNKEVSERTGYDDSKISRIRSGVSERDYGLEILITMSTVLNISLSSLVNKDLRKEATGLLEKEHIEDTETAKEYNRSIF